MTLTTEQPERPSLFHGLLSLIVPGLGQIFAGFPVRGLSMLAAVIVLGFLSVWTIAQRARFPEFDTSLKIFLVLLVQAMALLGFLIALRYLLRRFVIKDFSSQAFTQVGLVIFYLVAVLLVQDSFLALAGSEDELQLVYGRLGVLAAAALAGFWFWQAADAAWLGARRRRPQTVTGILIASLLIFILGWNITQIDLPRAVSEYRDTQVILSRILWPWEAAFAYEAETIDVTARVQAPCPAGEEGPPVNVPTPGQPSIVVTPTCGELSQRSLTGDFTLGTELTIVGSGFLPGAEVRILWKNPIGNPFTPRGVGETDILVGPDGGFTTQLNIPEAVIPDTASGAQIHTLIVRQESAEVFTGGLSREMELALVGMLETIMLGLMATFFGIIFAIPFSFLAARNLMAPITTTLSGVVGGLLVAIIAIWLASQATSQVSALVGGLERAPLQVAMIGLVLVTGLGSIGWRAGSRGMELLGERTPDIFSRLVAALLLGLLGAACGYLLGIAFSRGILSIAYPAPVVAILEPRYALGGAILLGLLGFIFAFRKGVSGEIHIGLIVYGVVRTVLNIVRSIEPLIWAIVGIIWIGPGPFAGAIALTVHTIASLGKLYSEAIESIEPGPIEAITATGANRLQTIMYAVLPQVLPPFISFTIYRWDINVRLSTIIGLVGGGGIGFLLIQWIRQFQYESAGIAVWLITITVAVLDYVSSAIRERFV
jgi:phosphonate ABC transporter permease subunit PhnE